MSLALANRRAALLHPWLRNELWRRARAVPSLDLRFAENKSLVDATSGANLVTFTRASSGTYVDSQGVIRTATTNLLLRSEEFGTWWVPVRTSVGANSTQAPTGAITADALIEDTSNNNHFIYNGATNGAGTYTFSIYAKAAGRSVLDLSHESGGNSRFTLTGSGTAAALGANTVSIQSIGNGWYRCISTFTATGAFFVYLTLNNGSSASYAGDGTSGIYLWGAQLEQSSTVGEYIPTGATINSAPRFDHNPITGESLGLLVEEQRTNLLLRSEEFSNATWAKDFTIATADAGVAPNGTTTADKVAEDSSNNFHAVSKYVSGFASGAVVALSIYAKASGRTRFRIQTDSTGGAGAADFDLSAGTATSGTGVFSSGSISNMGNGWYRCSVLCTASAAGAIGLKVVLAQTTYGTAYTGDGTSGVLLWGAQLEAGAFPTSYIKTEASAATRSADVCSISGSNFSSWYRQDEGTISLAGITRATNAGLLTLNDGSVGEYIRLGRGFNLFHFLVNSASGPQADLYTSGSSLILDQPFVSIGSYRANDFAAYLNGSGLATDLNGALPATADRMSIGFGIYVGYINGTIRRLVYWGQRLPNNVLQAITQ